MASTPPLASLRLGILGGGRLGLTLAKAFLSLGVNDITLKISHRGDEKTRGQIELAGLGGCLVSNEELCSQTDIQIIAIPPSRIRDLQHIPFRQGAQVVSAMAAISTSQLKAAAGIPICRMMPSGPDTILKGRAIAAIYPDRSWLKVILAAAGFRIYALADEQLMHYFTLGVCLPAALVVARHRGLVTQEAIHQFNLQYRDFLEIAAWARQVIPSFQSDQEEQHYIREMATAGGITQAIVESMVQGSTFSLALDAGLQRSKAIGLESISS